MKSHRRRRAGSFPTKTGKKIRMDLHCAECECVCEKERNNEREGNIPVKGMGVYVCVERVVGNGTNQILIKCYSVESHRFGTNTQCSR